MRIKPEHDAFAPIARGVAQAGVRVANERAVLSIIAGRPGVSNAEIARHSGLGPQTTSRILVDLESRDLIRRGEVLRGRRGQPATPFRINPDGAFSIGVEIGWQHLEVLLQNFAGKPLAVMRRRHAYPRLDDVLTGIAGEVATLLAGMQPHQRARLAGIGIASPATFSGLIADGHDGADDIAAWAGIDIAARVGAVTGLPAMWANDGNAIAWAALLAYPAPRPSAFATFFLGAGLGGGIISRSQLLDGARGHASHPAAIIVSGRDGRPMPAQALASLDALRSRLVAAGMATPEQTHRQWDWQSVEPQLVPWLDEAGWALAQAVMATSAITAIEIAVIDGDLPAAVLARLVDQTKAHLAALPSLLPHRPRVVAGNVGPTAAALGAAQMLLFRRHFSRAWDLFDA
jgi:predicted NBD/HSP70 family sugar kinase